MSNWLVSLLINGLVLFAFLYLGAKHELRRLERERKKKDDDK